MIDDAALRAEISRNMDYFQRSLSEHLDSHRGQYAVLKNQSVLGYFDDPLDADDFGARCASDGLYSIQEVTSEPVELGVYANAVT